MHKKYKRVFSINNDLGFRNYTVRDIIELKGKKKLTQVRVTNALEAAAAEEAGIDLLLTGPGPKLAEIRKAAAKTFMTVGVPFIENPSKREATKKAFEIIITAFNKGDKDTLKNLVSKDVYKAFEGAINDGSNNPNSQFYSLVIDGINDAKVENGKIIIGVNFISEQILSDNEEDIVKNKDTRVFEKPENSNGPAWTLVST